MKVTDGGRVTLTLDVFHAVFGLEVSHNSYDTAADAFSVVILR